jgi:hypothetical protein
MYGLVVCGWTGGGVGRSGEWLARWCVGAELAVVGVEGV